MIYVLSFDCANKSLACCILKYNDNYLKDIKDIFDIAINSSDIDLSAYETQITNIITKLYDIEYCNVWNLLGDDNVKGTAIEERCTKLKIQLNELDNYIKENNIIVDVVVIEDQMSINEKSRGVMYCLLFHYCVTYKVKIIKPSLKNKIIDKLHLGKTHNECIAKYSTAWSANKAHSKIAFAEVLKKLNKEIPHKKYISDIGDAYFQSIVYLTFNI